MAILSFKERFAGKVRNGSKRQTIRAPRKYPITPGERLYLYTALRTKYAKKLREVVCKSVTHIQILFNTGNIHFLYPINNNNKVALIGSITDIEGLNVFAKRDGFKDWEDMKAFWIQEHGVKKGKRKVILRMFEGILIKW
jgi:hypothetical protein